MPILLSAKQREAFRFFSGDRDMLIADGSVRSGKTFALVHGFLLWAATMGRGLDFGLAGRTIGTLKRNIIYPYIVPLLNDPTARRLGGVSINWSEHLFTFGGNTFTWYGGDKETSQFLIQGKTLAGLLVDESVTLLKSFLDQAVARCSTDGAKIVFSCNPGHPNHFFKREYIDRAEELNAVYLHWTMDDNPSLSRAVKRRYARLFSGVFHQRYVLGKWTAAEGAVFPQFAVNPQRWLITRPAPEYEALFVGVDFGGSRSKTVFALAGVCDTPQGPQLHLLDRAAVTDPGEGVDAERITMEYKRFFEKAVNRFGQRPVVSNTDHMDMLRLSLKRAVKAYDHRVVFVDKGALSLGEWVKYLNSLFNADKLKILAEDGTTPVADMFAGLLFDPKADDDRPLDDGTTCDVDTYDACRYALADVVKDWIRRGILLEA